MRILLLTQWFDPEPSFKGLLFARELRRQGHEIRVLTGFPNYPGGNLYPGYKIRPWQRETIDGISVLRVPLLPSHSGSGMARILNYVSFALFATLAAILTKKPDVVYVYHPPGTAALAAVALRILKRVPFVVDIQDMWPDTLAATGMVGNSHILDMVGWWMGVIYRLASHIVVLSPGFRRVLVRRGVEDAKISVIPNWTYDAPIEDAERRGSIEPTFEGRFNILFAGTMGKAQALETVLDAAELIQSDCPSAQFVLMGSGIETGNLQVEQARRGLNNVCFLPRRPPSEATKVLAMADALLVHLKDDPLFEITIPSKTQTYLQAGKPILMGVRGDSARMVEEAGAGIFFAPEDPQALVSAVKEMMSMSADQRAQLGQSGRCFYERELALSKGVARFAAIFAAVGDRHRFPTDRVDAET
jgi:glycosyltransferase involved in cell wall biosynthesis